MVTTKKRNCRLCKTPTSIVFNINFKPIPICQPCALSIFIQEAQAYKDSIKKQLDS